MLVVRDSPCPRRTMPAVAAAAPAISVPEGKFWEQTGEASRTASVAKLQDSEQRTALVIVATD